MAERSVTHRMVDQVSKPECSPLRPLTTMPQPGNPNVVLHFYDIACWLWTRSPEELSLQQLPHHRFTLHIASIRSI